MQANETNSSSKSQYLSLAAAKVLGAAWLAADPAAVEIEFTVQLGSCTMQIWIGRDGEAYDHSRFAE